MEANFIDKITNLSDKRLSGYERSLKHKVPVTVLFNNANVITSSIDFLLLGLILVQGIIPLYKLLCHYLKKMSNKI